MSDPSSRSQPAPAPSTRPSRIRRLLGWILTLLIGGFMAGYWLFNSSAGLQWTLASISRLSAGTMQFAGAHGTLHDLAIDTVQITNDEHVLTIRHLRGEWHPGQLLQKHIHIHRLSAASVHIQLLASRPEQVPLRLPDTLDLPFSVKLDMLKIDAIQFTSVDEAYPENLISGLALSLQSDGNHHRLTQLHGLTPWGEVRAHAQLEGAAPFVLAGQIDLFGPAPWNTMHIVMSGNLEHMTINLIAEKPGANAKLNAHLRPFSANPLTQLDVDAQQLNPASFFPEAPTASLTVAAHLATAGDERLAGTIHIHNSAALPIDQKGLPFSSIHAHATISHESVQLTDLHAEIGKDETLRGDLIWHWKARSASALIHVQQVDPQNIDSRIHSGRVSGQIALAADAHRQSAQVSLKDRAFDLSANIAHSGEVITLEQFLLRRNQSRLTGHGKLDFSEKRAFQLTAQLSNFNIAEFIRAPASNLNAMFHSSGQLSPELSGTLDYTLKKSTLGKSAVTGAGHIVFNGLERLKGQAELTAGSNRLSLQGASGKPGDAYQLTINAPALEQLGFGLSGDLHAQLNWKKHRAARDIVLQLASRQLHLPGNHHLSALNVKSEMHGDAVTLDLTVAHHAMNGTSRLKDFNVRMNGTMSDHHVVASARVNDDIPLQLRADGRILARTPSSALHWQGQINELSSTGKIPVRLKTPTSLTISAQSVSLDSAVLAVSDGFLSIEQLMWTPKQWKTQGHFSGIAIYPGNPQHIPPLALHMGGNWHFVSDSRLTGELHLHRERGDWRIPGEIPQLAGLERFQLHVTAQRDTIDSTFELISQQLGNAKAQLSIPLKHSRQGWSVADNAPLNGAVKAHINNLKWLDSLFGAGLSMNGQLQAQAQISGTPKKPDIQGTVTGKELSILLLEQGIDLQQGNLSATFQQADLVIDRLHFVSPHPAPPQDRLLKNVQLTNASGSLTLAGHLGLTGNDSRLNITLTELPIAHKTNYWIIASGSGQARLQSRHLSLTGHLMADAGLLLQPPENRPELSDDIVFVNVTPVHTQQKVTLDLDMNLNLGERFYIRASGLEGRLAGQLQILDDKKNKLKVNGTIAAQDTTFKAYGQDLTVRRGIVSFQGPLDDPALNVLAVREGLQVEAGVEILGSVRHPQIRLVSTPNVSETEKLSWIILGRKPDPGGLDATALIAAAGSILGGQSGSGITEQITRTFGLDELTVKQAGVGSSLTGQIGVVGKRLSSRAYLSYERSLATTTMGITKLTYNLTPRITIVTQAGEDNAADLFYTLQFD